MQPRREDPSLPHSQQMTMFLQVNWGLVHWEQEGELTLFDSLEISRKAEPPSEADHQVAALPQPPSHHPSI